MNVQTYTHPSLPFRARQHASLPEDWTKSSLLKLVSGIAHRIGLNATDVMVLQRIAQKTRAADYADPTRSPLCFERQIDMAASIGLSAEQWRRVERKLEGLRIIARETAANVYRGRVCGSRGLESCAGLSLEPLIARLDDLLRIEARQVEMTERLAFCRLEISKARREIKRLERDLADDPFVEVLIGERAAWVAPRGYQTLAGAEAHLGELDALVRESRRIVGLAVRMTGAAVPDDRCHKQSTTETLSVSCREPVGPEEGGEGEAERSDAGINASFIGCLTVARLRDLASEDLRFYIDHAPADGGPRTISDIDWAVLQRIRDLGIDPSAFEDAVEEMGWLRAMLSLIVIDRNRTHPARPVRSCGGALRAFTSRYLRGELDLRASIFGIWGREGRMH